MEVLKARGETDEAYQKVHFTVLNPKCITMGELYGEVNMATQEWTDGLASTIIRGYVAPPVGGTPDDKRWTVFDGPIDAMWIESMNSVMDDNKMLTLASNERIPLKPHMRLVFEIRDLRFATPATVSRAGILFISTDDGTQWNSLIQSWLLKLEVSEAAKVKFENCFTTYVKPTLKWMIKNVSPIVSLQDMNFVQTLLYMLDGTFQANPQILESEAADAIEFWRGEHGEWE
jgi:dynein heavy chain